MKSFAKWLAGAVAIALLGSMALFAVVRFVGPANAKPMTRDEVRHRQELVEQRAAELLPWVVEHTGYSDKYLRYQIILKPFDVVNRVFYGEHYTDQHDILAVTIGTTVIIPQNFIPGPQWDDAIVHELTHVLQNHNGAAFECIGKKEKEAYDTEAAWDEEQGLEDRMPNELIVALIAICPKGRGIPY